MGQNSCWGDKRQKFNNYVKTLNDNQKYPILLECYPTSQFKKSENELLNEGFICSICLGVIKKAVIDPCGHVYGEICIKNWLQKNPKCPFSEKNTHMQLAQRRQNSSPES